MTRVTTLPSGLLVAETPEERPAPSPTPEPLPADHPRCQVCGIPAPPGVTPFPFFGDFDKPFVERWHSHSWSCRHGATLECPTCYNVPREAPGRVWASCPVCGETCELT